MADRELLVSKLSSIQHCIERIESKKPVTKEILFEDYDLQDILSINLERAIQLTSDIGLHILANDFQDKPGSMSAVFDGLKEHGILPDALTENLKKAVGFRNIAVHEYQKIDWNIVHSIITNNLSDFRLFVKEILSYLG